MWRALAVARVTSVLTARPASAAPTELTYFYPVGVAGPLATLMNALVAGFNKTHPDIQ